MLRKYFNEIKFLFIIIFGYLSIIHAQSLGDSYNEICNFEALNLNNLSIKNEISEEILNELVTLNIYKVKKNLILYHFEEEYQIFIFLNAICTKRFLNQSQISKNQFSNFLHLFSIEGSTENSINIIKLVIQTKMQFNLLYYNLDGKREYTNQDVNQNNFTIKTNIFPYFKNKLFDGEYLFFENESINIFDENEPIFNDICYIYKIINETKLPELRKNLYYFKYDNATFPLLESNDNCLITNNSVSYENESFILEYTCNHNLKISAKKIKIYNISILSKEEKEKYKGPHSLKDQEKILYCNKETYNKDAIKKNVGFYISLFLLFVVFVCLIILIIQKYDVVQKAPLDSPPKRTHTSTEDEISSSQKKKVNFASVEILSSDKPKKKKKYKSMIYENENLDDENNDIAIKKKKKRKKKKTMIDDDKNKNEDDENNNYNNDLNWYSSNLIDEDNNELEDNFNKYNSYNNNSEMKKKKKIGKKKKKGKKRKKNDNDDENNLEEKPKSDEENKGYYHDGNDIYGVKIEPKKVLNKTMTQFPRTYTIFKENAANQIKNNLKLKRLVIITNLGKNFEEIKISFHKSPLFRQSPVFEKDNNKNNVSNSNEAPTNDNLVKNSALPMIKDSIINDQQNERSRIMNKLIGMEDDSFLSNIKRDYLKYNEAVFYDNRDYCSLFAHFLRLKNDLINIFYCNYSFAPYSIRLIKFLFFFHFMFYLETLCIGQKYYFNKYFSKEYQDFINKINNLANNNTFENYIISFNNNNITRNISIFENLFSEERREFINIHYLYTFKNAFARVLIPAAISFISYIFTSLLSPRRKILKAYLNPNLKEKDKIAKYQKISKKYKIIFIIFGIFALLLMGFFFYSITNYFVIFDDAKYDIPQSFILSGLIRFILDIIIWAIIANIRSTSIESHNIDIYGCIRIISELN